MLTSSPTTPMPSDASPDTTAAPARSSRLRGLSYLRNYTHNHLHGRDGGSRGSGNSLGGMLLRTSSNPISSIDGTDEPQQQTDHSNYHAVSGTSDNAVDELPGISLQTETGPDETCTTSQPQLGNAEIEESMPAASVSGGRSGLAEALNDMAIDSGRSASGEVATQESLKASLPSIRFSQHIEPRAPRPSLAFSPISRTLPPGSHMIKVGRYSEREQGPLSSSTAPSAAPVGFKSKVVSRRHCELWCTDNAWYIKDVKSSSGTFLNHVRLSQPGQESKPFAVKDGDIVQLGIDFKGGEEMIYRCVKIRIEVNRNWQSSLNSFNMATNQSSSADCSICLGPVAPCQSLFVAPCSHTWHFKCVRRIITGSSYPNFICPNCRAHADLEADVDEPAEGEEWESLQQVVGATANQATTTAAAEAPEASESEPLRHEAKASDAQSYTPEDDGPVSGVATNETSSPVPIPRRNAARTPSPADAASGVIADGPLTPRNNIGPFVLDGTLTRAEMSAVPMSLMAVADEVAEGSATEREETSSAAVNEALPDPQS